MNAPVAPEQVIVPGPKVIVMGNPGDGKTDTIRTIVAAGLKVFVCFSEPGMEVLLDTRRGKVYSCDDGLHWKYFPPVSPPWMDLINNADLINKFSYKALSEMAPVNREHFRGFYEFISLHANLKCERCGKTFGPADKLKPYDEWCVVDDSLSSFSIMALNCVVGSKPAVHEGEWGVAMRNLELFINKMAYDIPSMVVMMAHMEQEPDTAAGGMQNMVATLGKKLAPKIPRPWSDVIHARREGSDFFWSTTTLGAKLKSRHLPFSDKLQPDFGPLVRTWHAQIKAEKEAAAARLAGATPAQK